MIRSFLVLVLCFAANAQQEPLRGVIDIHVHSDPDSIPRSVDAIDLAKLARTRGMQALVLKNHYEPTASLAYLVRKEVPGIEILGGIALNRPVGGVNPAAVDHMTQVKGGWGRVVWMPTFDAENEVRYRKQDRPFVRVSQNGALLPEVDEVLSIVAKHQLTFETGHSTPAEVLMLVRAARAKGIEKIVVTHPMLAPVHMSVPQMEEAAKLGTFLEFVYNGLIGPNKEFDIKDYAAAIRRIGPEHCILASDLGQAVNPLPPDGLAAFLAAMRSQGFTPAQIDLMSKVNPAKALGLAKR